MWIGVEALVLIPIQARTGNSLINLFLQHDESDLERTIHSFILSPYTCNYDDISNPSTRGKRLYNSSSKDSVASTKSNSVLTSSNASNNSTTTPSTTPTTTTHNNNNAKNTRGVHRRSSVETSSSSVEALPKWVLLHLFITLFRTYLPSHFLSCFVIYIL